MTIMDDTGIDRQYKPEIMWTQKKM